MKPPSNACRCRGAIAVFAALLAAGCATRGAPVAMHTYLDVHRCGPGAVTAAAVAGAHAHDLEVQGSYGVDYRSYWVDETSGTIYCLVQAPSAAAASTVHRQAHGLVADEMHEVEVSRRRCQPSAGARLFVVGFDVGAGAGAATAVGAALDRHMTASGPGPRCLEYWFDIGTGNLFGLIEAADADAAASLCGEVAGARARSVVPVQAGH